MNPVEHIARGALSWLWETTLAAAVLTLLVLLIQSIGRRWIPPRWTYTLWLLVMVRLVLPMAPESPLSLFNLCKRVSAPAPELRATARSSPVTPVADLLPKPAPPSSAKPATHSRLSGTTGIAAAWLCGGIAYLLCCLLQYRRLLRWARHQPPESNPRLVALLRSAQQLVGYRRPVRLVASQSLAVPSVLGIARPFLLFPKGALETWNDDELRLAMLHELVHVRRRDNLLNWGLILVQAVHWFNPVVWFALRRLRSEREALCDAIVLDHISAEERQSYGAVLIKAAEQVTSSNLSPALVPIVNHKHEIQRRLRMIARFKPTPRIISLCAAAVVLALACVTFTGAAQKEKKTAPPPLEQKKAEQLRQQRASEGIKALEGEWKKIDVQIRDRETELDKMRQELKIPDEIAESDGRRTAAEAIRKLEELRIEAQAEILRITSLLNAISGMDRAGRRRSVTVACGDSQLSVLLNQLAAAEQKLAVVTEEYAAEHPEVKTATRMVKLITTQVDERIGGILEGMQVKIAANNSRMDFINRELEQLKRSEIEKPLRYRPYFQARRDLQSLQTVRERLTYRIIEEKVDLAVPRRPGEPAVSDSARQAP
jgi:beta-lactamase regulating signal transducer with metallopeptidase domain